MLGKAQGNVVMAFEGNSFDGCIKGYICDQVVKVCLFMVELWRLLRLCSAELRRR